MHTPEQILSILNSVRTTPKWPSAVEVPGLSSFDPTHVAEKQRIFDRMHASGLIEMLPGLKGRRTSQGYIATPKGISESQLLQNHPSIAKKS
jgi:hypothetical protein